MSNQHGRQWAQRSQRAQSVASGRWAGLTLITACLLLAPLPARAQVGHDPSNSPFRDITTHQALSFFVRRFGGSATPARVGARSGLVAGVRFETRLSGPMDLWASLGRVASSRFVVDPSLDTTSAQRITGPIAMPLYAGDLALVMNLAGRKSWHRLAPFLGVGFGIVTPENTVIDASGFKAGTNFTLVPTVGARVFVARRIAVRLEARDYYMRYEWPLDFFGKNDAQGNPLPPVLESSNPTKQWTHNWTFAAGLTYSFTF